MTVKISLSAARRLVLKAQLLDGRTKFPPGKEGVAKVIETLGYVQIDTIAVAGRAHHQTIRTRRPDYNPDLLHELLARDRRIFEYWGHALSYLPMTDYRFYRSLMRRPYGPYEKWGKQMFEKWGHMMSDIRRRIKDEGPLTSKDFKPPRPRPGAAPWERHPARYMLEMLFWKGELMIAERRKFARVFDLTERVLPAGTDISEPDPGQLGRFLVRRALRAYGVATATEMREHIHGASKETITSAIKELLETGEILPVSITGLDGPEYYTLGGMPDTAGRLRRSKPRLYLLSPFDNLIIQRHRIRRLFAFDYMLECYVPPGKRKYGYYVMPILWDERFVGRFDPKADRKKKILNIDRLLFEPDFAPDDSFLTAFAAALRDLADFNDCEKVKVGSVNPAKIKKPLAALLK